MSHRFELADPAALTACVDALKAGGLYVPLPDVKPALFAPASVVVVVAGSEHTVTGQVVNHAPTGFFVQLDGGPPVEALAAAVAKALTDPPAAERSEGPIGGGRKKLIDHHSNVPLHAQVKELTTQEKLSLARTANRPLRRLLIRDVDKRIHAVVLKNPAVTDDEMAEYTSIGGLSPSALTWVANQRQLLCNRRTLMNVVMNPMTPQSATLKLLGMLQTNELLRVSRSGRVRQAIQIAAKRKLMAAGIL